MSDILERFELAVAGMAALGDYPFPDRRDDWLARLSVNQPELEAFDALLPRAELGLLTQLPVRVALAGGAEPDETTAGVAAVARQARVEPRQAGQAAHAALAAARAHQELNAFIALADAPAVDVAVAAAIRRLTGSGPRSASALPLLGVPVAIKDLMAVAGLPQTNGTGGPRPAPATQDALAVARLRAAGAIVIGTTNLHELAYGITSANPHYGKVLNPLAPGFMVGGSSGGSAAAIAAGIVPLAIGTDTAGSIRLPAACCGIVGFKPGFDAVPRDGALTLGASLDHLGPMARTVADAALMYAVMAGQPPRTTRAAALTGLRVGVATHYFFDPIGDDVRRCLDAALARMRVDGAQLVPVTVPGIEHSAALQFITLCSEATDFHWRRLLERPETLGSDVRVRLEVGQFLPAPWYARAQRGRADLLAAFEAAFAEVDVLVTPTVRVEPPRAGQTAVRINGRDVPLHTATTSLTMPFNLTGMPALTMPCGRGDHGLPIGLQLAGRRGDDWRVLDIAARLESLLEGWSEPAHSSQP